MITHVSLIEFDSAKLGCKEEVHLTQKCQKRLRSFFDYLIALL